MSILMIIEPILGTRDIAAEKVISLRDDSDGFTHRRANSRLPLKNHLNLALILIQVHAYANLGDSGFRVFRERRFKMSRNPIYKKTSEPTDLSNAKIRIRLFNRFKSSSKLQSFEMPTENR
jgi:hypothetical protein